MRYRATLAYDGAAYQGFQRQIGDTPTVQRAVEGAVAAVTGQTVTVLAAGRTDTGVHATGQVIAFTADWQHDTATLLRALNATLPPDIALQDLSPAPPDFHPRFDARSRRYAYRVLLVGQRQPLWRNLAWQLWNETLDREALDAGASLLTGTHDFAAFGRAPQGDNTVRTVFQSRWHSAAEFGGQLWTYTIEADAFLHHMVRRVVWLLVSLGRGALTLAEFEAVLDSREVARVKGLAPPQGLTLEFVRYPE
jgi:tRNA pseudouridine38-40 synthase